MPTTRPRSARAWPAPRRLAPALLALALLGLAGCGKGSGQGSAEGPARRLAPVAPPGAVSVATRNTTRLGGADVASDAAAIARAVYPGLTPATRPAAVAVVDAHEWPAALAASVLAAAPTNAPILYSEGRELPAISRQTLEAMRPLGDPSLDGAQALRIGTATSVPGGYRTRVLPTATPAAEVAAIARLALALEGAHAARQAIVVGEDASRTLAMPAAGLAAESGAPILLAGPTGVPAPTASVLTSMHRPDIYVIDAPALSSAAIAALRHLGTVRTIPTGSAAAGGVASAEAAVRNAIEVARFTDGTFGWGVKEPGHGLVVANLARPLDAPAAALLSATGDYGPLLLVSDAASVPAPLVHYLSDIQPAYSDPQFPAVRGAYNHGWLIGDETSISAVSQAEIDALLEIVARTQSSEEPTSAQAE